MIKTFRNKITLEIYQNIYSKKFHHISERAFKKLQTLDLAYHVNDLIEPPSNKLEKLVGDKKAYWSIRINQQYRIIFTWDNGNAYDVEIVDYH